MNSIQLKITNSEAIEVKTTNNNSQKFKFSFNSNLKNKRIVGVQAFQVSNVSITPTGVALVNATVFKKSYLVLYKKNREFIKQIPLIMLDPISNGGNTVWLDSDEVDWENSYIHVASTDSLSESEAFLFNVVYKNA